MKRFGFHPEARSEFLESALYYEGQQEGLGRRFSEAIREALERIRANPLLYRKSRRGFASVERYDSPSA